MKNLFTCLIIALLLVSCGGSGGGDDPNDPPKPKIGPILKFSCEGADSYFIDILNITEDANDFLADENKEADIDLGEFNLEDGIYEIEIFGENIVGKSKTIKFDLEIVDTADSKIWTIVPIEQLIEEDPDYFGSFSQGELSIAIKKK
jgi:hypothetical protein